MGWVVNGPIAGPQTHPNEHQTNQDEANPSLSNPLINIMPSLCPTARTMSSRKTVGTSTSFHTHTHTCDTESAFNSESNNNNSNYKKLNHIYHRRRKCVKNVLSTPDEMTSLRSGWWRSWQRVDLAPPTGGLVLLLSVLCCLFLAPLAVGADNGIIMDHTPKMVVHADDLSSQSFHGNHSHVDYFRLLQRDGDSILIGARNIVYNVSIYDLSEHYERRIIWYSRQVDSDTCFSKGKSESECQNYIRVLAKKDEGRFLVCGTNAYKPLCRDYALQVDGKFAYNESSGIGKCPYNPRHNSTFVFADGDLYSGTVADFQGTVPLIFREPLKTDHNDFRHLNAPAFVHSFSFGSHIFFFFRETAVEYMNCGKKVYSRVARVCKEDKGVPQQKSDAMWTSFLKSRLNCSFPGEFPFYFDEIQSVSDVVRGKYAGREHEIIYGIFTTPDNSIPGSAICAFSMRDILDSFEGPFKDQKDLNSNWLPYPKHLVPEPRPGSCVNDSTTLPELNVNFVRFHPLMDELVPPFSGQPILMKASFNYRFTRLAVDPQVPLVTGGFMDVLFVATNNGIIFKAINALANTEDGDVSPVIIEELNLFDKPVLINNLQIAKQSNGESKLIIITDSEVKAISLERCSEAKSCGECLSLQDPYCGWYPKLGRCDSTQKGLKQIVMQNVSSGTHRSCPYNGENFIYQNPSTQSFTTEAPLPSTTATTCPPCICEVSSTPTSTAVVGGEDINSNSNNSPPTEGFVDETLIEPINDISSLGATAPEGGSNAPRTSPRHRGSGRMPADGFPPADGYPSVVVRTGKEIRLEEVEVPGGDVIGIVYSEGVAGPVVGASLEGPLIYSAETLAIAVTTACVAALVVGFISGFLFSRKCRGEEYPHFSGTPYLDSKLNKCDNLVQSADPNMYTANNVPPKHINNLVTNYNPKNVNNGKSNTNTTTDAKLLKPAKCAYI